MSGLIAIAGYAVPAGALAVVKNWANILGKDSADKIAALEIRVTALEAKGTK